MPLGGDRTISMGLVRKLRLLGPAIAPLSSFLTMPALTMFFIAPLVFQSTSSVNSSKYSLPFL